MNLYNPHLAVPKQQEGKLLHAQALRAIRYICQNATSSLFKKCCGGVAAAPIRDAQSWSGQPHPTLGNSLNTRVREAAKETLEEVFKLGPPPAAPQAPAATGTPNLQGRIQGYGSTTDRRIVDSYASKNGLVQRSSGTASAGKYGGFGSDDVRAAEAAGGSWRSAADDVAVCASLVWSLRASRFAVN